jgi:hypothetical protein
MTRTLFLATLGGLLTACGTHWELSLTDAGATRGSDDKVTLTAVVSCFDMSGVECKTDSAGYCVSATWRSTDGGTTADGGSGFIETVQTCHGTVLKDGEQDAVAVTSTGAIPKTGSNIQVTLSAKPAVDSAGLVQNGSRTLPSP